MTEQEAIQRMVIPSQRRQGKPMGGVIQIHVTRQCDKSCFNCTQGSNLAGAKEQISLDQFEIAVRSLQNYFGIVGVFGGNPALHKRFPELCEILRAYIPKRRCGLWCNKLFGNGEHARKTFNPAVSNLNVHLDQAAYDEFKRDWPESNPFGLEKDSRHSPVYVAMKDVIESEDERWNKIANCDINKHWSAMVGVFRGQVRGWFCEIAGAQAMLRQSDPEYPDTGIPVTADAAIPWWDLGREEYNEQIRFHCHRCGVPLRGYGALAQGDEAAQADQFSAEYADVFRPKKTGRNTEQVNSLVQLDAGRLRKTTDYMGNAGR